MSDTGILGLSTYLSSEPHFVEVGRAHVEGRPPPRLFVWSADDVDVALDEEHVRLHRRFGIVGSGGPMVLVRSELHALDVAMAHWAAHRDGWPAWYESHGPPPYGRASYWYRPPGDGKRQHLRKLKGRNKVRMRRCACPLDAGVEVIGDVWRIGERHAPKKVQVGLRYRVVDGLHLEANRRDARLWRDGGPVLYFYPGAEKLVSELCRLVDVAPSGPPG